MSRYEDDVKRILEGIDIESLRKLSVNELKMRNSLQHVIVQEAICKQDPRQEALIESQRAINSVLVEKIRGKGKTPAPVKVGMDTVSFDAVGKR